MDFENLQIDIDYKFKNINLLKLALVHKSSDNQNNNERLEYLGDAILNAVISRYLFLKFKDINEGFLTGTRSQIVRGETLTKKANDLNLLKYIKLSKGTANLSQQRKQSILEASLEAIIGSVFLDSDWEKVYKFILNLFNEELSQIQSTSDFKDPKTKLQELLQSQKKDLPKYLTNRQEDMFICRVTVNNIKFQSSGTSKRSAERSVAKEILDHFELANDK